MQRRRVLHAFTELLSQHGLADTTVERICAHAGVSRRTFYDLFPEREACLLAAFEVAVEHFAKSVVGAYRTRGSWCERLRAALVVMLERFDAEPELARLCVVETLKGDARVLDRRGQIVAALVRAVDEGRMESKNTTVPSPITADGIVGGALAVVHARMLGVAPATPGAVDGTRSTRPLAGALMSMIVQPYLGHAAAKRELSRPVAEREPAVGDRLRAPNDPDRPVAGPFRDLPIRFTYRTALVIDAIAGQPGASNREIANASGAVDQGQISKLLARLQRHELIANLGGDSPGASNAWVLTARGRAVHRAFGGSRLSARP